MPRSLFNKIDFAATYTNGVTTGNWSTVRMPITLESAEKCLETALSKHDPQKARIVRIKNTLALEEMYVSENMREEVEGRRDLEVVTAWSTK